MMVTLVSLSLSLSQTVLFMKGIENFKINHKERLFRNNKFKCLSTKKQDPFFYVLRFWKCIRTNDPEFGKSSASLTQYALLNLRNVL